MSKLTLDKSNVEAILGKIKSKHKDEHIIIGDNVVEMERVPTGSIGLDVVTGGGYPLGRFVELYGTESSGKSTCCIHAMVESQKKFPNKWVVYVDFEHSFDKKYAENIGLDMNGVMMLQPDSGEAGFDMLKDILNEIPVSMVVVDSIAAAVPLAETEGDFEDANMGKHARMMGKACRILTPICKKSDTVILFINQIREKIGVIYGDNRVTTGGNAMKFYASIRLELNKKRGDDKNDKGEIQNSIVKVKGVKNKTAPPFRECEFDVLFGKGIDRVSELITWGVYYGVITKGGSWYSYEGTKLGQGEANVKSILNDNIELCEELEKKILEKVNA